VRSVCVCCVSGRRAAGNCLSADLVSYTVARSGSASTLFTAFALNNTPAPALAAYGTLSLHGEIGVRSSSTSCRHCAVEPSDHLIYSLLENSLLLLLLPRSPQDFSVSTQAVWPFLSAASVAVMPSVCNVYKACVCVCVCLCLCLSVCVCVCVCVCNKYKASLHVLRICRGVQPRRDGSEGSLMPRKTQTQTQTQTNSNTSTHKHTHCVPVYICIHRWRPELATCLEAPASSSICTSSLRPVWFSLVLLSLT